MAIPSRRYVAADDLADLISFVTRVRSPICLADHPSPVDLSEILVLPANQAQTRLWQDEKGSLVGYGIVDHFNNILFDVVPDGRASQLRGEILDWAVQAVRVGRPSSDAVSLGTNCRSEDGRRIKILLEKVHGLSGRPTLMPVCSLRDAMPQVALPPGWGIRAVRGEGEVDALVALHRAAFGTDRLTVVERLSWIRGPTTRPSSTSCSRRPKELWRATACAGSSENPMRSPDSAATPGSHGCPPRLSGPARSKGAYLTRHEAPGGA